MTKRYDICAPRARKDSEKVFWVKIGSAFEGEKGIGLEFDALPIPDKDGRCSARLFEPKAKDGAPKSDATKTNTREPIDDEIPF